LPKKVKFTPTGPAAALSLVFCPDWRDAPGMDFVTVAKAIDPEEAELIRSRLEANGFLVNVKNEDAAFSLGLSLVLGGVEIQVLENQADSARALLQSQDPPSS
jgi:hypothetical protein